MVASALLLAVAPAAPVPREIRNAPPYFPTKVGATWKYRFYRPAGDGPDTEYIEVVRDVTVKGGVAYVAVTGVDADGTAGNGNTVMAVSGRGILEGIDHVSDGFTPYGWLLRLPAAAGDTWDW